MAETVTQDWTRGITGASNTSPEFEFLSEQIGRIIMNEAHSLLLGRVRDTGGLIMAVLAHRYGLVPTKTLKEMDNERRR